jgi:hypothetical protein
MAIEDYRDAEDVIRKLLRCTVRVAILLSAVGLATSAIGQGRRVNAPGANLWISHWGDHKAHERWSIHTEGHWRRTDLGLNWQQLLLRPAVNHHMNDQVMITGGYSYYINYPYGAYPIAYANWEHNAYEQVQLGGSFGRLKVAHRFRLEQRFLAKVKPSSADPNGTELDSYVYQNRFRYRAGLTVPLGRQEKIGPGVFTANIYDEVFLNFGDSQRLDYIQQNRVSALLGYQVNGSMNVMLGYLLQTIQRPGAAMGSDLIESNSTIHVVLVYNIDLRRKSASTQDPTAGLIQAGPLPSHPLI